MNSFVVKRCVVFETLGLLLSWPFVYPFSSPCKASYHIQIISCRWLLNFSSSWLLQRFQKFMISIFQGITQCCRSQSESKFQLISISQESMKCRIPTAVRLTWACLFPHPCLSIRQSPLRKEQMTMMISSSSLLNQSKGVGSVIKIVNLRGSHSLLALHHRLLSQTR